MKRILVYCNLFWLFLSLLTCIESYRVRLGTINKPGSGLFPFSVGFVMLVLVLISLFQSMRTKGDIISSEGAGETSGERFRWWNILIILGAIIVYALTLEKVGFLINSFLFIVLLLRVIQPQTWKISIIAGLISAVVADLIFNVVFRAQIPSGILGF